MPIHEHYTQSRTGMENWPVQDLRVHLVRLQLDAESIQTQTENARKQKLEAEAAVTVAERLAAVYYVKSTEKPTITGQDRAVRDSVAVQDAKQKVSELSAELQTLRERSMVVGRGIKTTIALMESARSEDSEDF